MRIALICALLAGCASAPSEEWGLPGDEACPFLRAANERVETAVVRLRHRDSGRELLLIGTFHIGSDEYYAALGEHLRGAGAVLSESKMSFLDETTPPDSVSERLELIQRYQAALAKLLGVVQQRDWERRVADDRWVPLDLPVRRQRPEPDLDQWRGLVDRMEHLASGHEPPHEVAQGRQEVIASIRQMAAVAALDDSPSEWQRERDEAIFRGLAALLEDRRPARAAMLHGPGHLRALAPRIESELGYEPAGLVWIPVFKPS